MDFLLILLGIGGLVVAGVMLVLASRTARMERESDARVQTLQMLATGSVLFAPDAPAKPAAEAAQSSFETPANAYPFVMTVPAEGGRIFCSGSFNRARPRSRT